MNEERKKRKSRFSDLLPNAQDKNEITNNQNIKIPRIDNKNKVYNSNAIKAATEAAAKISATLPIDSFREQYKKDDIDKLAKEKNIRSQKIWQTVQEQINHLKNIPGLLSRPSLTLAAAAAGIDLRPAPLKFDSLGRPIDENDNLIIEPKKGLNLATVGKNKTENQSKHDEHKELNPYLMKYDNLNLGTVIDPRIKIKHKEKKIKNGLNFIKEGTYIKEAEILRQKEAKDMIAGYTSGRNQRSYKKHFDESKETTDNNMDIDLVSNLKKRMLSDIIVPIKTYTVVPDIEWWDIEYLPKEKLILVDKDGFIPSSRRQIVDALGGDLYQYANGDNSDTIHLIEHPSKNNSFEAKKKQEKIVIPLMLTKVERKKIRRQARAEKHKEIQDKIALGLLPTPEPKVKLSNMMRVLTEQSVADPSLIERKVREQIAQRQRNHEMRNEARKLTPEERREKKRNKLKKDALKEIRTAVFRIEGIFSNGKHRYKVDVNAQQLLLTGVVLVCEEANLTLVIVEGGPKSITKFCKLMERRIKWNEQEGDDDDSTNIMDDSTEDKDINESKENLNDNEGIFKPCVCLWEGIVSRKTFNNFKFHECKTIVAARKIMETKHVEQYWDMAYKFDHSLIDTEIYSQP